VIQLASYEAIYFGMHYLITGHTGFKGSWLTVLLQELGHEVSGYSLAGEVDSLYSQARLGKKLKNERLADIRDLETFSNFVRSTNPDVLIHFAAQSLVRESYRNPNLTFEVNVLGTLNVLQVLASMPAIKAALIITTDKVYLNNGYDKSFTENDPLGGAEPYGKSKAIADQITQYWINNNLLNRTSIVRAGNVIGGGDISSERLMPELISSYLEGNTPILRYPEATRPWQHVLDCLNAYLYCVEDLLEGNPAAIWNVGPDVNSHATVKEIQEMVANNLGKSKDEVVIERAELYEAHFLSLDSTKLRTALGWQNKYDFEEAVRETTGWHIRVENGESPDSLSKELVRNYLKK
jgi:CDP-glucose 4,6-dehydratase